MTLGLICAFVLWYLYYGFECALNGGNLGRHPLLMPFQCFWEEVLWNIPGGFRRKMEYVRENVIGDWDGAVLGRTRSWRNEEVRVQNLLSACTHDVMRGPINFWLTTSIVLAVGYLSGYFISSLFV